MAGVKGKSGRKPYERIFHKALTDKLDEMDPKTDRKRIFNVAEKLVSLAEEGDVVAIKEVMDRTEGKVSQQVTGGGDNGEHEITFKWKS